MQGDGYTLPDVFDIFTLAERRLPPNSEGQYARCLAHFNFLSYGAVNEFALRLPFELACRNMDIRENIRITRRINTDYRSLTMQGYTLSMENLLANAMKHDKKDSFYHKRFLGASVRKCMKHFNFTSYGHIIQFGRDLTISFSEAEATESISFRNRKTREWADLNLGSIIDRYGLRK